MIQDRIVEKFTAICSSIKEEYKGNHDVAALESLVARVVKGQEILKNNQTINGQKLSEEQHRDVYNQLNWLDVNINGRLWDIEKAKKNQEILDSIDF